MLQVQFIRENNNFVREGLKKRNFENLEIVDLVVKLDEERRGIQQELDKVLYEINQASKEIGQLYSRGKHQEANARKEEVAKYKDASRTMEEKLKAAGQKLHDELVKIPNIPHTSVPFGKSANENVKIREGGNIPDPVNIKLPHWDLAAKFDIIDFELGTRITGSGFPVFKGNGAKLQRALIQFFIDQAVEEGYLEIVPPLVVNENSAYGTGQLPDKEGQMYHITADNLYLIPTAEVPLTNIYKDHIFKMEDLPAKMVAYTPCFRREAGSYGKDVRGLNRLHQFDKVEIVQVANPETSYGLLEKMVDHVENLLNKLELPYRIVKLCGGDMGFTSALTYDFEVYSAGQDMWLEVSSVSNFESFQANRLQMRYKDINKKNQMVHTLNGSALALPRIIAALVENNQSPEGIRIPAVLRPYTGFEVIS